MLKRLLLGAVLIVAAALAFAAVSFERAMRRAKERLEGRRTLIPSPFSQGGAGLGPAVLVVHGSGGGFDQGELVARAVLDDSFHWIAPSRFGYLRSALPAEATFDEQADAYAALLDHLGVDRAAVIALSHGGPSALLLAVRHPDRVSSLTLISAGVASSSDAAQPQANRQGDLLTWIFAKDHRYWAITRLFRKRFLGIMGVNEAVVAGLSPEQRRLADEVIDFMNPVSRRAAGVLFDNRAAMPNERIDAISAPTLVLHAEDDTLQLFRNAEYAAAHIPGSHLVAFDRGGPLLLAVEQPALRKLVQEHVRKSAG